MESRNDQCSCSQVLQRHECSSYMYIKYKETIYVDGKEGSHTKLATKHAANFVTTVLFTVSIGLTPNLLGHRRTTSRTDGRGMYSTCTSKHGVRTEQYSATVVLYILYYCSTPVDKDILT
jgi:hypothetical protein